MQKGEFTNSSNYSSHILFQNISDQINRKWRSVEVQDTGNVFIFSSKEFLWAINFFYNARLTKSSLFEAYRNPFFGRDLLQERQGTLQRTIFLLFYIFIHCKTFIL